MKMKSTESDVFLVQILFHRKETVSEANNVDYRDVGPKTNKK